MLYVLNPSIGQKISLRILGIFGFAALTALGAQVSIPREPVPITLQVLMVLAAGLTLGWRDGAASQAAYLAGIAANLPIAANGMGSAAFSGPTAGYLYAFPLAAAIVGLLAVRNNVWVRWAAGLVAVVIIYIIGATYLKYDLAVTWSFAWQEGVKPFILIDMAKALLAAAGGEGVRLGWQQWKQH